MDDSRPDGSTMLEVSQLTSYYADLQVLRGLSLHVDSGEIVALFGPNGHGKSTLLKTISGMQPAREGEVRFNGQPVTRQPAHKIVEAGLSYIPEERHLFRDMTVLENLNMGAYNLRARQSRSANLEFVLAVFPRLAERKDQLCFTLSGGESRMVAIARGLMSEPKMLLVDEPSIGLSPSMRKAVFEAIAKINREKGISILIVEQEIRDALALASRIYMLKRGNILFERPKAQASIEEIEKAYF